MPTVQAIPLQKLAVASLMAALAYPAPTYARDPCRGAKSDLSVADFHDVIRQGKLATRSMKVLSQMQALAAKAKNPNVPINKQLSQSDLVAFGQLRAQLIYLTDQQLFSSDSVRDKSFILNLCLASERVAQWRSEYLTQAGPGGPLFSKWIAKKVASEPSANIVYDQIMLKIADTYPSEMDKQLKQRERLMQLMTKR